MTTFETRIDNFLNQLDNTFETEDDNSETLSWNDFLKVLKEKAQEEFSQGNNGTVEHFMVIVKDCIDNLVEVDDGIVFEAIEDCARNAFASTTSNTHSATSSSHQLTTSGFGKGAFNSCVAYGIIISPKRTKALYNELGIKPFKISNFELFEENPKVQEYTYVNSHGVQLTISCRYDGACCDIDKKRVFIGIKSRAIAHQSMSLSEMRKVAQTECHKDLVKSFCNDFNLPKPQLRVMRYDCDFCT